MVKKREKKIIKEKWLKFVATPIFFSNVEFSIELIGIKNNFTFTLGNPLDLDFI